MNIISLEWDLCQNIKRSVASWLANPSAIGLLLTAQWYMNQETECHLLTYWENYFWHQNAPSYYKKMLLYISTTHAKTPAEED